MNMHVFRARDRAALLLGVAVALSCVSTSALACACGCGLFDIGGFNNAPNNSDTGLSIWGRYDFVDQNQNFGGASSLPAAYNKDKKIETSFYTLGGQYMIDRDWGVTAMLPFYQRAFTTTYTDASNASAVGTFNLFAPGDMKVMGNYSGFSPDRTLGAIFGLKLPTGAWKSPTYHVAGNIYSAANGDAIYDRDTMPGTGSTDFLIGGFTQGELSGDHRWVYFAQAIYQFAFMNVAGYRPGNEFDVAVGTTYELGAYGPATKAAPVLQLLNSWRKNDSGWTADPLNSGYARVLIAPGLDLRFGKVKVFADIEVPIYQNVNHAANPTIEGTAGQLVASVLYKLEVGYDF